MKLSNAAILALYFNEFEQIVKTTLAHANKTNPQLSNKQSITTLPPKPTKG